MKLTAESVAFAYPRQARVLDGVSFALGAGEVLCLLGPNGTGKTTLLRCLLGIQGGYTGHICLDGRDVRQLSARARAQVIAYVPQSSTSVFAYTVMDITVMGRSPHLGLAGIPTETDIAIARAALDRLGIGYLADRPFGVISGGERQLTLIARALAQETPILVLDEPTASLDYGNQVRILQTIHRLAAQGLAILMTSHFPDHAFSTATAVALMKGGRIVASGPPDTVISDRSLSDLYGVPVRVLTAASPDVPGGLVKVCVPIVA